MTSKNDNRDADNIPRNLADYARDQVGDAMRVAADENAAQSDLASAAPKNVGPYRILEALGEGGMGIVYLAEQTQPIRRRVALKLIKPGMDSRQVLARFNAERQALALMNHPNIAKVLDVGATELGRPYFVMEYVPGLPITEYCDKHHVDMRGRLDLFMQACHAVQHAHQKAIIHRDIKPSNILVVVQDKTALPKVIDFGVAKATQQSLTENTLFTEQGQLVGTPEYMSPEQAEMTGLDVDTRTDIYSLGVVLYELLVGALPFEPSTLRQAGFAEIQRIIREKEPSKPSARLSSLGQECALVAKHRRIDLSSLLKQLRGDLDWIIMKALDKDRTRRYETASDFAADILRHLNDEPVVAGPPSTGYRMSKFVRRNRSGVVAASVLLFVLLAGITGTTWAMLWAFNEKERAAESALAERLAKTDAQQKTEQLETVTNFQASMLADIDTEATGLGIIAIVTDSVRKTLGTRGESPDDINESLASLAELLEGVNPTNIAVEVVDNHVLGLAVAAIENDFSDQPLVQASLLQTVSETYAELGLYESAMPLQQNALKTRRHILGDDDRDTLESIANMGDLLMHKGKYKDAEPLFREALKGRRNVLGDDHRDTRMSNNNLGLLFKKMGMFREAEAYLAKAVEDNRRILGDDHPDTLESIMNMDGVPVHSGNIGDGWVKISDATVEAMEGSRRQLEDDHPSARVSSTTMAKSLMMVGRIEEAQAHLSKAVEDNRRILGDDHPDTLTSISFMCNVLMGIGKYKEAEPLCREALIGQRRVLVNDHSDTLTSIRDMGSLLMRMGKLQDAESYYREALIGRRRKLGDKHPDTLTSIRDMGSLYQSIGKLSESEKCFRENLALTREIHGEHVESAAAMQVLARCLEDKGDVDEAEKLFRGSLAIAQSVLGHDVDFAGNPIDAFLVTKYMTELARFLQDNGGVDEAENLLRESLSRDRELFGDDNSITLRSIGNLGNFLNQVGKHKDAFEILNTNEPLARHTWPLRKVRYSGDSISRRNKTRRKVCSLGKYLAILGDAEGATSQFAEGEATLLEAHELLAEGFGDDHDRTTKCITRIITLYQSWHSAEPGKGYDDNAAEWRQKMAELQNQSDHPPESDNH